MGGHGLGVAPVPVQALGRGRGGGAHGEEQVLGRAERQLRHGDLGVLHGDLGLVQRRREGPGEVRPVGAGRCGGGDPGVQGAGGVQDGGLGGEGLGGDPPGGLLDQRVVAERQAEPGVEGPPASGDGLHRVPPGRPGDAGQHGQQHELEEGGLVDGLRAAGGAVQHGVVRDAHPVEDRGAGAGELLPEAVPVVLEHHALGVRGDDGEAPPVAAVQGGRDAGVVAEDGAGGVELPAGELPALGGPAQHGVQGAQRVAALLRGGVADGGSGQHPRVPDLLELPGQEAQGLHEAVVGAVEVGDVGVGLGQVDQQPGEVLEADPGAAVGRRDAQGTEPGPVQPADLRVGQRAPEVPVQGAGGDLREQRPEVLPQPGVVPGQAGGEVRAGAGMGGGLLDRARGHAGVLSVAPRIAGRPVAPGAGPVAAAPEADVTDRLQIRDLHRFWH